MKQELLPALIGLLLAALGAFGCQQSGQTGSHEYQIAVTDKGFEPAELKVPKGRAVTLVITRKTDQTCATEVVFASLEKRFALPLNQPVRVDLPASDGGTLSYVCGMNMLGGKVVVQ